MTLQEKQKRAAWIGDTLDQLYPTPPIPLHHHNAFTLLVAVLMSAQTTDKRVNMVTPALFQRADSPEAMVKLSPDEVLEYIRTVGLAPTKSRNIIALSRRLIDHYDGKVPGNLKDLKTLPGVGQKTASVVMAQWFNEPAFPVDTHIHRLAKRWHLTSGKNVTETERDLKALFPIDTWNRRHLQIIYYGREYCPARNHDIETCPICNKILLQDPSKA